MPPEKVLVLGASSDLGCELLRRLSRPGVTLLAHYNSSRDKLEALRPELSAGGARLATFGADLSKADDAARLAAEVKAACGHPDAMVFFPSPRPTPVHFEKTRWEAAQAHLDIQLKSAYCLLQAFLPEMARAKAGKVVFVLSAYTLGVPPKGLAGYVAAKYAVLGLMKALAAEYAGRGVNINAVSPSMVETRFLSDIPRQVVELAAEAHPLKRNAVPKDVAPLIEFLLSDGSAYITGANIPVSGGLEF